MEIRSRRISIESSADAFRILIVPRRTAGDLIVAALMTPIIVGHLGVVLFVPALLAKQPHAEIGIGSSLFISAWWLGSWFLIAALAWGVPFILVGREEITIDRYVLTLTTFLGRWRWTRRYSVADVTNFRLAAERIKGKGHQFLRRTFQFDHRGQVVRSASWLLESDIRVLGDCPDAMARFLPTAGASAERCQPATPVTEP